MLHMFFLFLFGFLLGHEQFSCLLFPIYPHYISLHLILFIFDLVYC